MAPWKEDHIVLVEATRGSIIECQFRGSVAIVNAQGQLVASLGNPRVVTLLRSTAKPFQVLPLLEHPDADLLALTLEEIAVMAGSHNGEDVHVEIVRRLLQKRGLSEDYLRCGTHPLFLFSLTEKTLLINRHRILQVQHNCSGKNAGMLLLASLINAEFETYQHPEHPVQQAITAIISEFLHIPVTQMTLVTDSCGVPTYAARLDQIAYTYAQLAMTGQRKAHGVGLSKVREAMMAHPFLVAGTERLETDLMLISPVIAKIGAQGLYCISIPAQQLGIAIKIESGVADASEAIAVEILFRLGSLPQDSVEKLSNYRFRPILTSNGTQTGIYRPVLSNIVL